MTKFFSVKVQVTSDSPDCVADHAVSNDSGNKFHTMMVVAADKRGAWDKAMKFGVVVKVEEM